MRVGSFLRSWAWWSFLVFLLGDMACKPESTFSSRSQGLRKAAPQGQGKKPPDFQQQGDGEPSLDLEKKVSFMEAKLIKNAKIPQLSFKIEKTADYVEILRCAASYRSQLRSSLGAPIETIRGTFGERREMEYIWAKAKNRKSHC